MILRVLIFLLIFINSSYSHELRPAIANLNIYEKDNIINANLSIQLNLEAIITEIDFNHSNTEQSAESNQYEKLRNMSSDELIKNYNNKIQELVNKIYLMSSNTNYNLSLIDINIPEIGNPKIIRNSTIQFDIKNLKDEELKFYWEKKLGPIIFRVNSINNEDLYSGLIESWQTI